ncbi:MAG: alpha/beta hydrolase fold protein [Ilumatobacteraceae bacterium]|nr:alpha/beta hydrolase fold protein [Ilumatobacteraceae bacterium]
MDGRHGATTVRGLRWGWHEWGDGPVDVVFVHGFQNDHTAWERFIGGLALGGRRFTAVDLPGCGDSAAPPTWQRSTIGELALDLGELLRARTIERPLLVGHSLGAAIALQLALDQPDTPTGLVLFAPASTRGLDFVDGPTAELLAHPSRDDQRALLRAAFRRLPDAATIAALEATVLRADPRHIEGAARSMRTFVIEDRLAEIAAPTLLIAGDRDRHVPIRNHIATWAALPRAGLHVLHDVGHVPFVEAQEVSTTLVEQFIDHERRA